MADILYLNFKNENIQEENKTSSDVINVSMLRAKRTLDTGYILPAEEDACSEVAEEHKAEPIKSLDDIKRASEYLISEGKYRDNMLFIVGINFGLRVSDLRVLKFSHLINSDFSFKTTFPILEKKTKNTRKVRKNRYITINDAVIDAVTLFLSHNPRRLDEYMFCSESNNGKTDNKPMAPKSIDRMLKDLAKQVGLTNRMSTHSLRKTFGYHQMVMSNNDPRKLLLLQKIFGHATAAQTLDYIGITDEEIRDAYLDLNLGRGNSYLVNTAIGESVIC